MTKKDFFVLIIKLFGLFSIITSLFVVLPRNISLVLFDFGILALVLVIFILAIIIGLFIFLIFKSHYVVRLLKLEKGFDNEKLELGNLTTSEIVKIAIVIIGGFLIIDNLPLFLNQTINAFYADIQSQSIESSSKFNWFISGLNILIGYLLITNLRLVVRLLRIKTRKED